MTNVPTSYLEPACLKKSEQLPHGTCLDCKSVLNIGIFFDGTGNNLYEDMKEKIWKHSNVARLYNAYRDERDDGYYRHYIQGVGTPFKEIGELGSSTFGGAFSYGGEARIIWGLLQVLNSLHSFINDQNPMFDDDKMTVLASQKQASNQYPPSGEEKLLYDFNLLSGLVGQTKTRRQFLARSAGKLKAQLEHRDTTPNISGIYLDVFGFSRGAAQARAFCNWLLDELMSDGKLCGVPAYVRILGLFDTVASVSWSESGHCAWATTPNLRIHPAIKNCVHYAALHEFRNNFQLDSVCEHGVLPPNCYEQIGPGSHSDMGGSYKAGEQGKGIRLETPDPRFPEPQLPMIDESYCLSQLPLNLMLEVARRVGENHGEDGNPWLNFRSEMGIRRRLEVQFSCDNKVRKAVEQYFATCAVTPGPIDEMIRRHNTMYLAWRRQVNFAELPSVRYAVTVDDQKNRNDCKTGEDIFRKQLQDVDRKLRTKDKIWTEEAFAGIAYHGKAGKIYKEISTMNVPSSVGMFFDRYIHDSYASFIGFFYEVTAKGITRGIADIAHIVAEPKRYLTYRILYQGDDQRYNT